MNMRGRMLVSKSNTRKPYNVGLGTCLIVCLVLAFAVGCSIWGCGFGDPGTDSKQSEDVSAIHVAPAGEAADPVDYLPESQPVSPGVVLQVGLQDAESGLGLVEGRIGYSWSLPGGSWSRREVLEIAGYAARLVVPSDTLGVTLEASAKGYATSVVTLKSRNWVAPVIPMFKRAVARIELVDSLRGKPLPSLQVDIEPVDDPVPADGPRVMRWTCSEQTGSAGLVECALAVGDYVIKVEGEGGVPQLIQRVSIRSGSRNEFRFVLEKWLPFVSGRVIESSSGNPVLGAVVMFAGKAIAVDADGGFELELSPRQFALIPHMQVRAVPPASRSDLSEGSALCRWHDETLTIALPPRRLEVEVVGFEPRNGHVKVEGHDSRRVPAANPEWVPLEGCGMMRFRLPGFAESSRGCLLRLSIDGDSPCFVRTAGLPFRDEADCRVIEWRLNSAMSSQVTVTSAKSGLPVEAATVEVLSLTMGGIEAARTARAAADFDAAKASPLTSNFAHLLKSAQTDSRGRALVSVAVRAECFIRVSHPDYEAQILPLHDGDVEVAVRLGDRLTGCVSGVVRGLDAGVIVLSPLVSDVAFGAPASVLNAKIVNGAFAIGKCAVGRYRAFATLTPGGAPQSPLIYRKLGDVDVQQCPSEPLELNYSSRRGALVRVEGDGVRVGDDIICIGEQAGVAVSAVVPAGGVIEVELPEGCYSIIRRRAFRSRFQLVEADERICVDGGAQQMRAHPKFSERSGRVRLLIRGKPVGVVSLDLAGVGALGGSIFATSTEGWLDLPVLPSKSFVLLPSRGVDHASVDLSACRWHIDIGSLGGDIEATIQ